MQKERKTHHKARSLLTFIVAVTLMVSHGNSRFENQELNYGDVSNINTTLILPDQEIPIEVIREQAVEVELSPPEEQEESPPSELQEILITTSPTPIIPQKAPSSNTNNSGNNRITWYYCEQVPGAMVGDGGGYCKGEGKSGITAACGPKWAKGTVLEIEGYGRVICDDRGNLGYDQVDVYFQTNQEAQASGLPSYATVNEVK